MCVKTHKGGLFRREKSLKVIAITDCSIKLVRAVIMAELSGLPSSSYFLSSRPAQHHEINLHNHHHFSSFVPYRFNRIQYGSVPFVIKSVDFISKIVKLGGFLAVNFLSEL